MLGLISLIVTVSINNTEHADTGPSVVRASAFILSVIVLSDKMLSIIILSLTTSQLSLGMILTFLVSRPHQQEHLLVWRYVIRAFVFALG